MQPLCHERAFQSGVCSCTCLGLQPDPGHLLPAGSGGPRGAADGALRSSDAAGKTAPPAPTHRHGQRKITGFCYY